jgi:hypothetical protein
MTTSSNGWRTFIRPRDGASGLNALHRRADGLVTVWHQPGERGDDDRYRLTAVYPDGAVRQATGRTKRSARNALRPGRAVVHTP